MKNIKYIKNISTVIMIILLSSFIGSILLMGAFFIPVNEENKNATLELVQKEGWYPVAPEYVQCFDEYLHSYLPGVLDGGTDPLMINFALADEESSILNKAMVESYARYWHGYILILRPLLFFFSYSQIRVLNGIIQVLLMFVMCSKIQKELGNKYVIIMFLSYIFLMPLALASSLQYSWIFYVGCIGFFLVHRYKERKEYILLNFLILGILTSYFDLLTYPLFSWGIPAIWWVLFSKEKRKTIDILYTGLLWIIGYAGMWIMKWVIASIVLRQNVIENAVYQIFLRGGMQMEEGYTTFFDRLRSINVNWMHYEYKIYFIILIIMLLFIFWISITCKIETNDRIYPLALIAASPFVWYFVVSYHTLGHHFFTYRIFNILITALCAIIIESYDKDKKIKFSYKNLFAWGMLGLLSAIISYSTKEELWIHNGGHVFNMTTYKEDTTIEIDFVPSFSEVVRFDIGIASQGDVGEVNVSVMNYEENVLWEKYIPMSEFMDTTFYNLPTEWKLEKGEKYVIVINISNTTKPYSILTTGSSLPEFVSLTINDELQTEQFTSGIVYKKHPPKSTMVFIAVSMMLWGSALLIIIYNTYFKIKNKKSVGHKV